VKPPDILWIVTTQWRAAACGYAGDPNARTPALDALAAASVNYTQAVTPHPLGPQARAALLTGELCPENGVRDYWDPLPSDARTIAHELRERGYATAYFGKWHLYRRDRGAPFVGEAHAKIVVPPEERGGFEFWEGFESGFLLNDPWLHGTRLPEPVRFEGYQSDVVCARAGAWLAERKQETGDRRQETGEGQPWFCVVSLEAPHPPYGAPAAGVAARRPEDIVLPANVPRGGDVEKKARAELAGYYAHIEATDRAIGRLVKAVEKARASSPAHELAEGPNPRGFGNQADQPTGGLAGARPSIIVFTSVHGDMHGAHGLFRKGWPHEESVRVPLLVRGAPRTRGQGEREKGKGRISGEAVSLVDLPAMTLAWARGEGAPSAATVSFQQISMPSAADIPRQCPHAWWGVRTPTRKLVLREDGSPWLFFDLADDPGETRNLVGEADRQAEIATMRRLDSSRRLE